MNHPFLVYIFHTNAKKKFPVQMLKCGCVCVCAREREMLSGCFQLNGDRLI